MYPVPVIVYGPSYLDNSIQSPPLEMAHELGDPLGSPLALNSDTALHLSYWAYMDNPLDPLVFQTWSVAAQTQELPCLSTFRGDEVVYYADNRQWLVRSHNVTQQVAESALGGTVTGVTVKLNVVDMCGYWCGSVGTGLGHTPAPYFDNVRLMLVSESGIAWNVSEFHRFQDSFPLGGDSNVRLDSAINVEPVSSPTLVIGDSTVVGLNMDLDGGILELFNPNSGVMLPALHLWYRVIEGPHAGSTDHWAMADQDASDGIWSPTVGTQIFNTEIWNGMQADSARYQGQVLPLSPSPYRFAFDFNDAYFLPGDIIAFFFRAESVNGTIVTDPPYATSGDPDLREYHPIRCLPSSAVGLLFVEDDSRHLAYWREAFQYNGYSLYDIFSTQAPSSGQHNGLGAHADLGDLAQYEAVVWDSGDLSAFTIGNAAPADKAFDSFLLDDWLTSTPHNTWLWVLGNQVAHDLGVGEPFLAQTLGVDLLDSVSYYDDVTDILVPLAFPVHPALLGDCSYWVLGGCPTVENISLVAPLSSNPLAVTAFEWEVEGMPGAVAGTLNMDPDGNGLSTGATGHYNWVAHNPYGYPQVTDAGCDSHPGLDYARFMVQDILAYLFGYYPDAAPDGVPEDTPVVTRLAGHYPNPFNPDTKIHFGLASTEHVRLAVYDLAGRKVRTLVDERLEPAYYEVGWDGRNAAGHRVASGVYFYTLRAGDYSADGKMVLLK